MIGWQAQGKKGSEKERNGSRNTWRTRDAAELPQESDTEAPTPR